MWSTGTGDTCEVFFLIHPTRNASKKKENTSLFINNLLKILGDSVQQPARPHTELLTTIGKRPGGSRCMLGFVISPRDLADFDHPCRTNKSVYNFAGCTTWHDRVFLVDLC